MPKFSGWPALHPASGLPMAQLISVASAPTRWGRVGFAIQSSLNARRIDARLSLPSRGIAAQTRLRLRAREGARIKSVALNGRNWKQFDAASEVIVVPPATGGELAIVARY